MPPEIIKFPYSKKAAFTALTVMIVLILLMVKTCINSYSENDMLGTFIFGFFAAFVLALMLLMIVTRLKPALDDEIAMEMDENGIKDYLRNIVLDWKDIEDIGLKPGRVSAMLVFELKFDSDLGKQVFFSLRWVEGKDTEIYKKVLAYFDEAEGIERVYEEDDDLE